MSQIEYEVRERVAWLRINRPEARNACSVAMLMEMQDRVYAAQVDEDVHTLVIVGNGGNLTAANRATAGAVFTVELPSSPGRPLPNASFELVGPRNGANPLAQ